MVFSSAIFLFCFLPLFYGIYFLSKEKFRNAVLLLFSLFFYAWGEPKYILIMIISIVFNYTIGIMIHKYFKQGKLLLVMSILFNIGLLFTLNI